MNCLFCSRPATTHLTDVELCEEHAAYYAAHVDLFAEAVKRAKNDEPVKRAKPSVAALYHFWVQLEGESPRHLDACACHLDHLVTNEAHGLPDVRILSQGYYRVTPLLSMADNN